MASDKTKGLTIEFEGDTSGLSASIKKINKDTASLTKELKSVDKALQFNPKNVELIAQKTSLLEDKMKSAREKVDLLTKSQDKMKQQFESGQIDKGQYDKFKKDLVVAESQLKTFTEQLEKHKKEVELSNTEFGKYKDVIKKSADEMRVADDRLKGLNEALKSNKGSIELLTQKQEALTEKHKVATRELEILKEKQQEINQLYALGKIDKGQYDQFKVDLERAKGSAELLKDEIKETNKELNDEKMSNSVFCQIGSVFEQAGEKLKSWGGIIESLGRKLTKYITAPLAGLATMGVIDANSQRAQRQEVLRGVGVDTYNENKEDFESLISDLSVNFGEVPGIREMTGSIIATLNTHFGLTGDKLRQAAEELVMFSYNNNITDPGTIVDEIKKSLSAYNDKYSYERLTKVLELYTKAGEGNNAGFSQINQTIRDNASIITSLGWDLDRAIQEVGTMLQNGINPQKVFAALTKGTAFSLKGKNVKEEDESDGKKKKKKKTPPPPPLDPATKKLYGGGLNTSEGIRALLDATKGKSEEEQKELFNEMFGGRQGLDIYEKNKSGLLNLEKLIQQEEQPKKVAPPPRIPYNRNGIMPVGIDSEEPWIKKEKTSGDSYNKQKFDAIHDLNPTMATANKVMETFKTTLGDLADIIMTDLKPAVDWLSDKVDILRKDAKDLTEDEERTRNLMEMVGKIAILGSVLIAFGKIVKIAGSIVGAIGFVFNILGGAVTILSGVSLGVIAAVGAIGVAVGGLIYLLVKHWDTIKKWFERFKKKIKVYGKWFGNILKKLWNLIKTTGEGIGKMIGGFFKILGKIFKTGFDIITGIFDTVFGTIWKIVSGVFDTIINLASGLIGTLKAIFTGDLGKVGEIWSEKWGNIKSTFSDTWDSIKNKAEESFSTVVDSTKDLAGSVVNAVSGLPGKVGGIFSSISDSAKSLWDEITGGKARVEKELNEAEFKQKQRNLSLRTAVSDKSVKKLGNIKDINPTLLTEYKKAMPYMYRGGLTNNTVNQPIQNNITVSIPGMNFGTRKEAAESAKMTANEVNKQVINAMNDYRYKKGRVRQWAN
jgi:phage-related minor tail protein